MEDLNNTINQPDLTDILVNSGIYVIFQVPTEHLLR